jgi:serine/threonine-protein kinase PRP4
MTDRLHLASHMQESIKKVAMPAKPSSDMKARLMPLATVKKMQEDEAKLLSNFVNLLERALELDPSKRLTPKEALNVGGEAMREPMLPRLVP